MNRTLIRHAVRAAALWLWYWAPPLLWMAMIFYLSSKPSLPTAPGPWLDDLLKKLSHVVVYTVLYLFLLRAFRRTRVAGRASLLALMATAAYGLSDELHQSFVPGRSANWYDVAIDVAVPLLLWGSRRGLRRGNLRSGDQDLAE
jgi:VanZ family protein